MILGLAVAGALGLVWPNPGSAQSFTFNPRPPTAPPRAASDNQMLVQAVEVTTTTNNSRVSAGGNVPDVLNGHQCRGDKVIYVQKTIAAVCRSNSE